MPNRPVAANAIRPAFAEPLRRGFCFLKDRIGRARVWAQPVTFIGLAMLTAIYGILGFLIVTDRHEALAAAKRQGDNLVRIIDQSYSNIFQSFNSSLLFLRKAYLQDKSAFDIADWAQDTSIRNDLAFNFTIADANGQIVNTSNSVAAKRLPGFANLNIADRAYFQDQLHAKADALLISAPLTLRASGKKAIVLTRRITTPDGKFGGIVTALVSPLALARSGAGADFGPGSAFGLVRTDGTVLARVLDGKIDENAAGRKLPLDSGIMADAMATHAGHFWNTPGPFDKVSRLASYRTLDAYPLIAVVATTDAEIYRRVDEVARIYWLIALLLTAAILLAIRWGVIRERKLLAATSDMAQAQHDLQQSQERYTLVEDAVSDGIWDWNILTGEVYRSPRWKAIVGYDDERFNHVEAFRDLLHPDDIARFDEAHRAHMEDGKPYGIEFRLRQKSGNYRWVFSRGKAIRDAAGHPVRMLGSVSDISERKAAEESMHENRFNLARAEAMMLLGHYKYESKTEVLTWSEGTYRIFGKSPDLVSTHIDQRH